MQTAIVRLDENDRGPAGWRVEDRRAEAMAGLAVGGRVIHMPLSIIVHRK
jgi:hypothetical protein